MVDEPYRMLMRLENHGHRMNAWRRSRTSKLGSVERRGAIQPFNMGETEVAADHLSQMGSAFVEQPSICGDQRELTVGCEERRAAV
jgi:hypothetical protein